jgi:hypothetical protein
VEVNVWLTAQKYQYSVSICETCMAHACNSRMSFSSRKSESALPPQYRSMGKKGIMFKNDILHDAWWMK